MSKANSKSNTRSPDAALMRLGAKLHQQIEEAYSHWKTLGPLRAPLDKQLDRMRRTTDHSRTSWEQMEKVRAAFDRTAPGRRASQEYKAFCKASTPCCRTAKAIMRKRPQTVAGAAVFAMAAFFDGEWGGFGFRADDAAGRIVRELSDASKIKLPNGVRQAVQS